MDADFIKDPLTGEKNNYTQVSGYRENYPPGGAAIPFEDGRNWFSNASLIGESIEIANFSRDEGGYFSGNSSDEALVNQVGGGRFFQEGWWNNPFTPNLI